jgi:CubicO group peptidase (beta-lactamase class C family)
MRKYLAVVSITIAAAVVGWPDLNRTARIGTGYVSHILCSQVLVAGVDEMETYRDFIAPNKILGPLGFAIRYNIDRARREVRARIAGGFESRSIQRGDMGCMMLYPGELSPPVDPAIARLAPRGPFEAPALRSILPEIAGSGVVAPKDERLGQALDRAFAEPADGLKLRTRAVVVVHNGHVIAERYAPGLGVNTPMLGFSDTKSVMNALIGILVRQHRLKVDSPAPVPAWNKFGDPRAAITIDNLLRMQSGLSWYETLSGAGIDSVSRMWWSEPDIVGFAESMALEAPPGTGWKYNSGNTMILSRIIRDLLGGHAEDVLRFAREELFDPLGMRNVTLTFDPSGTPLGGFGMFASARDWARFGLLYLKDGEIAGRTLLPAGWVRYSITPTNGAVVGYGAGFYVNTDDSEGAKRRIAWGMPRDAFMAIGYFGQVVVIVPSAHLVVARFGVSYGGPLAFMPVVSRLVADVVATLPSATD